MRLAQSCRSPARSPCRSPRSSRASTPSNSPMVGKFCTPEKPMALSSARNCGMRTNGSVPFTPARTGVERDHREHFASHVLDDLVRVAVGEQSSGGAASGHAVAARVVDDDQVDAAGLLALGRQAGARAASDDGDAAFDHGAELLQDRRSRCVWHGWSRRCLGLRRDLEEMLNQQRRRTGSLMCSGRRISCGDRSAPPCSRARRTGRCRQRIEEGPAIDVTPIRPFPE